MYFDVNRGNTVLNIYEATRLCFVLSVDNVLKQIILQLIHVKSKTKGTSNFSSYLASIHVF